MNCRLLGAFMGETKILRRTHRVESLPDFLKESRRSYTLKRLGQEAKWSCYPMRRRAGWPRSGACGTQGGQRYTGKHHIGGGEWHLGTGQELQTPKEPIASINITQVNLQRVKLHLQWLQGHSEGLDWNTANCSKRLVYEGHLRGLKGGNWGPILQKTKSLHHP